MKLQPKLNILKKWFQKISKSTSCVQFLVDMTQIDTCWRWILPTNQLRPSAINPSCRIIGVRCSIFKEMRYGHVFFSFVVMI